MRKFLQRLKPLVSFSRKLMTEQQIRGQLARLKIFGQLDELEYQGYEMALKKTDYTQLVRAVDYLIINHTRRGFPYPSEILTAVREQYKAPAPKYDYSGDGEITRFFLAAFSRIFFLPDKDMFKKYNARLLDINERYGDRDRGSAVAELRQLIAEVDGLGVVKVAKKEKISEFIPDDELPF